MEVAGVLERPAALIEPEGAWTQRAWARDSCDTPIWALAADAMCWCARGAIRCAGGDAFGPTYGAEDVLGGLVGGEIATWNDAPGRTQAEVVTALREAAALARGEQS